jgi:hypothetical protein
MGLRQAACHFRALKAEVLEAATYINDWHGVDMPCGILRFSFVIIAGFPLFDGWMALSTWAM